MRTLARLCFWVPPGQMEEFEAIYNKKIVPVLKKHDLVESSERGRPTVEGVFSRLFEIETPGEVTAKGRALRRDPEWVWPEVLWDLEEVFGTPRPDGAISYDFRLYTAPAGSGKIVEAGPGFRQGLWHSFGVRDGLPASDVNAILEDREGSLWIAADGGGAVRYDGAQFAAFGAGEGLGWSTVLSLLEDQHGNLWFGTGGAGVSRFDGERFVTFTSADGLACDHIWCLLEDRKGDLWLGGWEGGISRYDGERFTTFAVEDGLASNRVRDIAEDREGNLWIATDGGGVSRYDRERFVTFTTEEGLASNTVWSILEDRAGHLWFGTGEGVSRYDGERFIPFATQDGPVHNAVSCILETREGDLWFGSWGGGVTRYNPSAGSRGAVEPLVTFTTADGLASNGVSSIVEDREGYLWFGTGGGGVSRYDEVRLATFDTRSGLPDNGVRSLLEDRDSHLWFGTRRGVSTYDGEQFATLDGLVGKNVCAILEDKKGHLWFSTFGDGVSRYDGKELVTFTTEDGLVDNKVKSIAEDREGNLWFGSGRVGLQVGGVSQYDGVRFVSLQPMVGKSIWDVFEDREGNLWFGAWGGIYRYDGRNVLKLTTAHGLADDRVRAICEDKEGHLWFGTWNGVSRYDGKEFVNFTPEDGLAHYLVTCILQDGKGHLWFGTSGGGVSIYDGLVFQTLSRRDGLANDTVQDLLQDRNRELWIATEGGVTRYRPHHTPPAIHLKEVIADRTYGPVQEIRIPSSQKVVIFEFQGRCLTTPPDRMAYVVRLKGYDADWKPNYEGRMAYHDLPVGEYTFQVKAVDRDLNYSEPAAVQVTVEPDLRLAGLTEALSGAADEFVGNSPALRQVKVQLAEVAPTDLTVLILGETGTGKGLAARILHGLSPRKAGPFIPVNCGAIPEGLVESELFGHEKGAFTGAVARKLGKVELAEGGTLFLDEIGDLAMVAQAKLLRFLEEKTFERVGGTETLQADVRMIAATNRDLEQMVDAGTFRADLYFRLQGFRIALPPLRERREDIPELASYFMERMAAHLDKKVAHLTSEALASLHTHAWPGNVRELEYAVNRAVVVCPGSASRAEDIALGSMLVDEGSVEEIISLEEHERRYIRQVLERTGWVVKGPRGAAAALGLPSSTLRNRMKKLGIRRK